VIAVLKGGPADGRILELIPGTTMYRVPVVTDFRTVASRLYVPMESAYYQFSGTAEVDAFGTYGPVIYKFERMERG
jgi:hypothetical protein